MSRAPHPTGLPGYPAACFCAFSILAQVSRRVTVRLKTRWSRRRVGVDAEVAEALELEAAAGLGAGEARLDLAAGQHLQRVGIQAGLEVLGLASRPLLDRLKRWSYSRTSASTACGRRDPVDGALDLAPVRRVAAARLGIVGAAQLDDLAGGLVLDDLARR